MDDRESIAVLGANGHTGRFVIAELLRRNIHPIAVVRPPTGDARGNLPDFGAHEVEIRHAALDHEAAIDAAFYGAGAIINCAGPFVDTAEPVIQSALRLGCHYLDVTSEQASVEACFAQFDAPARKAGVVVMPGASFFGGFTDLLATVAAGDWDTVDAITAYIGLDSWHPTHGTRRTAAINVPRQVMCCGQKVPQFLPPHQRDWRFPAPFGTQLVTALPLSEIPLIAHHIPASEIHTYVSDIALQDIRNPDTPPPVVNPVTGRSSQQFMVEVIAQKRGVTRSICAHGHDLYHFTAPLVCEAAKRLIAADYDGHGVLSPGAAFDAAHLLATLSPEHIRLNLAH
ncbi:saccharopine dehydrogenase [Pseudonocardia sp. TMWB2A]|uniref:saccharopine dehydrogenase NADP-binding domain-containing protein n=1 Tax=Pseudonocardia sp. TMWB2A TaxID=687430 RepID=UPI00307DA29D